MKSFIYHWSLKTKRWGWSFDSLFIVEFERSIEDDNEFLLSQIRIYHNPRPRMRTNDIPDYIRRYTTGILMHHKVRREAYIWEIKADGFKEGTQLAIRKAVVEKYMFSKIHERTSKIVFCDKIFLEDSRRWEFCDFCNAGISLPKRPAFQSTA